MTKAKKVAARVLVILLALGAFAFVLLVGFIVALSSGLPTIRSLEDYEPKQSSVIYAHDGQVVGRLAKERREVVAYDRIPKIMVRAVLAAEDAEFFSHEGIDYRGILRCVVRNVLSGRKACGASTITQQTAKTFFLDRQKTYNRKLREFVLAKRIEDALTKNDILFLYLNQIYFGHGAYGVQEAARTYFGKDVSQLDVPEAALLAALPNRPARLDPFQFPEEALNRRRYVLRRLLELGDIDKPTFDQAVDSSLELTKTATLAQLKHSYYLDHVRGLLEAELGEEALLTTGIAIHTGIDSAMQISAEAAIADGVEQLDRRQGWRGALRHFEPNVAQLILEVVQGSTHQQVADRPSVLNLAPLRNIKRVDAQTLQVALERIEYVPPSIYTGLITKVDDATRQASVNLGGVSVTLTAESFSWVRPFSLDRMTARVRRPSEIFQQGDLVLVRVQPGTSSDSPVRVELYQEPSVQAALVAIDPLSREVRALVGGTGSGSGRFNRAIQAHRQAGSTFKPIVYAAAFETGNFSPTSTCIDAPRVYRDQWTGRAWKPMNYGHSFDGELPLRRALTLSKNLCSVELIDKLGVDPVLDLAKRLGIESPLPRNLTLALGSGDVTPLEMVNAYASFDDEGAYRKTVFIRKLVGPDGTVRLPPPNKRRPALRPAVAYQVVSLMKSVVEEGTAQDVKRLGFPIAGKTGTSNEARNAWFIGFSPTLVAGVWVGFDNNDPLGPGETGGRAAIPIWISFMETALKGSSLEDFKAPQDIVFAIVDPKSGKLAPSDYPDARAEPFIRGTEPTDFVTLGAPARQFGLEDIE
jgi:penicillin-binding protein 1A